MITRNYLPTYAGLMVASGEGSATVTANSSCQWAIGASATIVPDIEIRHTFESGNNTSMSLAVGEYLWVFGSRIVAVTAENPAAGDI